MARDFYERKISSEEAREGYIFVEKSSLAFFPPVGQAFDLADGGGTTQATVEARDCECRGPEKPHQHYFIRRGGLAQGSRWRFVAHGGGYALQAAD